MGCGVCLWVLGVMWNVRLLGKYVGDCGCRIGSGPVLNYGGAAIEVLLVVGV